MKNTHRFKAWLVCIIIALGFLLHVLVIQRYDLTPETIRGFILSFGWWAPLLYILLYTVRPLILFPASILSIAGGLTFGPLRGTLYVLIGASLGAYLAFGLTRRLGKEATRRWFGKRLTRLDAFAGKHGFHTVLFFRLVPLFPFDAVNYGFGLSNVRFRDYALATTLGIIPGAFAYNYLGHSLHDIVSWQFFSAVAFVLLLAAIPVVYRRIGRDASMANGKPGRENQDHPSADSMHGRE